MTPYRTQIESVCTQFGLDPKLLEALVMVESGGHADAFRHEPQYAIRYKIAQHPIYKQWPVRAVASSYGLVQIMFPTAYELGYREEPEYLFVVDQNLYWGALYLSKCFDWANQWNQAPESNRLNSALASYNGGRNGANSPLLARPRNLDYAARVLQRVQTL